MKMRAENINRYISTGQKKSFHVVTTLMSYKGKEDLTISVWKDDGKDVNTSAAEDGLEYREYTEERRLLLLELFRDIDKLNEQAYDALTYENRLNRLTEIKPQGGKEMETNKANWISEMIKQGHRMDTTVHVATKEEAEDLVHEIAMEAGRTYQEHEIDTFSWFEVVNHDSDKWRFTVYFEKPEDKQDEEPCRGSLDVGIPIFVLHNKPDEARRKDAAEVTKEEIEIQSVIKFKEIEEINAYDRYCRMMMDSGQTPAGFAEFKKWARQL